jgi:hypothetical protein
VYAQRRLPRTTRAAGTLADLSVIAGVIWWIGSRASAFTGTPKGNDATGHLSKARFILDNWPHISWNYEWYSGQPTFAGSYPPGYHVLLAALASTGRVSLATAMNLVSYGSVLLVVVGLYATVRAATGRRLGALVAAGLLLGTPTLWAQSVVLGLYPRLAALGLMSVAVAAAVSHSRRGGRWRGALACVLLALCLSLHPIVGVVGVGLIVGVYLLDPGQDPSRRCLRAAGVVLGAFGLAAYFYLPLLLSSRSQSLFTDTEVSLSWSMLFVHAKGRLDGLTPMLLPLGVLFAGFAMWQSWPPEVSFEEKVALGTQVTFLSTMDADSEIPAAAGPETRRYVVWFRNVVTMGLSNRLAVLFAVGSVAVFGYGLIGLAVGHFPWYINGLQPADLLVYPAYLLSGVIGLVLQPVRTTVQDWLVMARFGIATWTIRVLVGVMALVACASVIVSSAWATSRSLSAAEWTNSDVPTRASVLPAAASGQRQFRFAGAGDVTSEWVNEYSDVPQVRGYDDHGALHLDWQSWLEDSLLHPAAPAAERTFLLDWYGVRWIDTDAGIGGQSQFDSDPAEYQPLKSTSQLYFRIQTYAYRDATPILSASSAPAILVVGDDQDYDLLLRGLALSGVDSRRLIPVHGPTSLDDVTPALLSHFQGVALYGAQVGDPAEDAAVLGQFVRAGGGLFVDGAEVSADVGKLVGVPGSPLPVAATTATAVPAAGWGWSAPGDATVVARDLPAFGPPAFADTGAWATQTAKALQPWAHPVLDTHGKTVAAAGSFGSGQVFWEGINLPYHLAVFRSGPEAAFLGRALLATVPAAGPAPASTATFVNAQARRLVAAGGTGVLFKEQDAPGWHATVNGHASTIYPAGPGMMWIPLDGAAGPVTVTLDYRLSVVEDLGYVVSALTAIIMLALLLSRRLRQWGRRRTRPDQDLVYLPREIAVVDHRG